MAIAFDTSTGTVNTGGSVSTITWSHTCTGSNLALIVHIYQDGSTSDFIGVGGVTYNGVSMTRVDSNGTFNYRIYSYILLSPATGANTVSVTVSTPVGQLGGVSQSYTGANQSGQPDSHNSGSATIQNFTLNSTVVAANCWLVGASRNNNEIPTAGTGTIIRTTENTMVSGDSNGTVATGSQGLTWNGTLSDNYIGVTLSLAPVSAAAAALTFKSLLGVGI